MLGASASSPRIRRPDLEDPSLQMVEHSCVYLFHFMGNEFRTSLRVHCADSLAYADKHIGNQQSSRPGLVEGRMKDFLWQIRDSKSVAAIPFPKPRATLQNAAGDWSYLSSAMALRFCSEKG